jgi:hypothetical protein
VTPPRARPRLQRRPRLLAHALALLVLSSIVAGGGNLTVSLTAEDDLLVVGDEHNNGAWRESGYLSLRNSGGTINGGPSSYAVPEFSGRLIVALGGGNDSFGIMQTFAASDIVADLGEGDNRTSVEGGAGDDRISLFYFGASDLRVRAGAGHDEVIVRFCYLEGRVRLEGGSGVDSLRVEDPGFAHPPKLLGFESRLL